METTLDTDTLPEVSIFHARQHIGVHEIGTTNSGPMVDKFLACVGLKPGAPWCAAAVSYWVKEAARELDLTPKMRFSASAFRLHDANPTLQQAEPARGRLVVWAHAAGKGHVGIVTGVDGPNMWVISGNTSAAKGTPDQERNGGTVAEKQYPTKDRSIRGYVEIA